MTTTGNRYIGPPKPTRAPKRTLLTVTVDPTLLIEIETFAKAHGMSRAPLVREAVIRGLRSLKSEWGTAYRIKNGDVR